MEGAGRETAYLIPGFHAVKETLSKSEIRVSGLWLMKGKKSGRVRELLQMAEQRGISVAFKEASVFEERFAGIAHQGVAALAEGFAYADMDSVAEAALQGPSPGLLVAADHLTDEGNLGALIRTAAFFGAHGLLLPKDRSAGVTYRVFKRSSGGHVHLPIARVVNLARALENLKKDGFWIVGAAEEGPESLYRFDWNRHLVLVLGSEGRGLTPVVRKRCDLLVRIPSHRGPASLNVSVAAGVILSETVRQRTAAVRPSRTPQSA
jgi:23S rRNA (guanosine2251-2'-O)-methyltransferase